MVHVMSEAKKYRADWRHVVETEFDDAQFVGIADFDAQRLRADTAEAELAIIRPERNLYKASSEALEDQWNAAERRIADGIAYVQRLVNCSKNQDSVATGYLSDILAALNQKSEGESHE